jgi:hypothetical protein
MQKRRISIPSGIEHSDKERYRQIGIITSLGYRVTNLADNALLIKFVLSQSRPRFGRRLGKGNRRTDVQRIRGQATDERISTNLDCIKNGFWVSSLSTSLTYTIYTYYSHMFPSVSCFETFTSKTKNEDHVQETYRRRIKSSHCL